MPLTSQIVTKNASADFHSLAKVVVRRSCQNVNMANEDKNGGPNYLQAWREYRNMTQETLADKLDTSPSVISMLESGERGLSAKWLRRLAPVLGVQPGYILDFAPNDLDSDLLDIWVNTSPEQRRQLVDVAKAVVRRTGTTG